MEEFTGTVISKPFATGSKSERNAVWLRTDSGDLLLRRRGGNPMRDPELEKLVGKTIRAKGLKADYLLHVSEWSELPSRS